MDAWMEGGRDGCVGGWKDVWVNGWVDELMD